MVTFDLLDKIYDILDPEKWSKDYGQYHNKVKWGIKKTILGKSDSVAGCLKTSEANIVRNHKLTKVQGCFLSSEKIKYLLKNVNQEHWLRNFSALNMTKWGLYQIPSLLKRGLHSACRIVGFMKHLSSSSWICLELKLDKPIDLHSPFSTSFSIALHVSVISISSANKKWPSSSFGHISSPCF